MGTTATATPSSSFSTAKHTLKYPLINNHFPFEPLLVKLPPNTKNNNTRIHSPLLSQHYSCYNGIEPITTGSHRWRTSRITATVAAEQGVEAGQVEVAKEEENSNNKEEGEGKGEGEGEINTKLYFGDLPYHCDSAQLAGIVQQYGNPELVEVLYDRDTGRSRGFGFVTMSNIEDCNSVIQNLDGTEHGGRHLRVNLASKPRKKEPLFPETEHKLFVGNLSWSVTSERLEQAFEEYGDVVGARVLYDGDTGKSRGYGFVCYATRSEMENALASLDGLELEGRAIRVSLAEGKKT